MSAPDMRARLAALGLAAAPYLTDKAVDGPLVAALVERLERSLSAPLPAEWAEAEARAAAATLGPWWAEGRDVHIPDEDDGWMFDAGCIADAAFIAGARADVLALIRALRASAAREAERERSWMHELGTEARRVVRMRNRAGAVVRRLRTRAGRAEEERDGLTRALDVAVVAVQELAALAQGTFPAIWARVSPRLVLPAEPTS